MAPTQEVELSRGNRAEVDQCRRQAGTKAPAPPNAPQALPHKEDRERGERGREKGEWGIERG